MGPNYSLRQLDPPGSGYEKWFAVKPGMDIATFEGDPRLDGESLDFLKRLCRLTIPYQRCVPMAAVQLDMAMDSGYIPFKQGDGAMLVPLDETASVLQGEAEDLDAVRTSVHQLHATGALLVETVKDAVMVRLVAHRPRHPGEPWVFMDELGDDDSPEACIPNRGWSL